MSTRDMPTERGGRTPVPPRGAKKSGGGRPGARQTAGGRASDRPAARPDGRRGTRAKGGPAAWQARRRRNRMLTALGAVAVVVVVVVALVAVKLSSGGAHNTTLVGGVSPTPVPAAVVNQVTGVPVSTLVQASGGATTLSGLTQLKGQPALTSGGKPQVLYIGADFCPFCAAERWSLVAALSKFGTFTHLGQTTSASGDVYPNSPTFSFYGSTYTSRYLTFTPVETTTNQENSAQTGYVPLQTPTPAQNALWKTLDPNQSIPFVDLGGRWLLSTSSLSPSNLSNKPMDFVSAQVGDNNTVIGKGIDQNAGALVKDICSITGGQPADVCSAAGATR